MNGRRQHIFMRIGHQEGGLSSRFGIKEDEYTQRLVIFMAAYKDVSDLTDTTVCHVGHTVLLLGRADVVGILGRDDGLEMARTVVEGYIVHGREHARVTEHRENKKSRKRKYREVMYCLREKREVVPVKQEMHSNGNLILNMLCFQNPVKLVKLCKFRLMRMKSGI
ncbi:hypothetical protein ACFX10_010114 [Malus domestica]